MKLLNNLKRAFTKVMVVTLAAGSLCVSCYEYDDTELREKIDMIVDQIYELEQKLNQEIDALRALLKGQIFVSDVSVDVATGITNLTLSNGSVIQVYPKEDMESYVTYIELSDGVKYWAYIDKDGNKQLFLDANKKPVPVEVGVPEIITKDGETYIVIGGVEYPLAGNSVFSDFELHTDEYTGEIYAVTFTFGEDMTFTVAVDGASCFRFVQPSGWSTVVIEEFYVPLGTTQRVQVDARGVVDYILEKPDGWEIKEEVDPFMGSFYFNVTAPSAEKVAAGIASAGGVLKVCAVLEGGKATISKLELSSNPFKTFAVSYGNANVEMYPGLQKYVYGICPASEYDEAAIFAVAEGLLYEYDYPAGYGVADYNLENVPVAEIAGAPLTAGAEYVFWALPAIYFETLDDAGYYLNQDTFISSTFKYSSVKFEVGTETFRDAILTMELEGVDSYYVGISTKENYYVDDVLYAVNYGLAEPKSTPMDYNGSVFKFVDETAESNTEYVAWFVVNEEGKTYVASDVLSCEFKTTNLTAGGTIKVTPGTIDATPMAVTVPLSATGADMIYYTFIKATDASKYPDDAAKAKLLFEKGKYVKASSVEAVSTDVLANQKPLTNLQLFAVAVDSEGFYGDVCTVECQTSDIKYNSLTVNMTLIKNDPNNVQVEISTAGGKAEDYLYWIGKTSATMYKSSGYLGGSAETAQVYMYLNATSNTFATVAENYPVENGVIVMDDLSLGEEYVVVAMAKDANGGYSKATELKFTTLSLALGNIVMATDPKWEQNKPVLTWHENSFQPATGMMSGEYAFSYDAPDNMTTYVVSGTDSYFGDEGSGTASISLEKYLVQLIEYADRTRDVNMDPTGGDNWEWYHFCHGYALLGYGVIFPEDQASHIAGCDKCYEYQQTGRHADKMVVYSSSEPVTFRQPYAIGKNDIDKVYITFKDADGNFYEPYCIDVPDEYFE